ncbi:hypothetical protein BH11PAT2_BH11PAT2_04090 [soil metagenome]
MTSFGKGIAVLLITFFLGGVLLCMSISSMDHSMAGDSGQMCPQMSGHCVSVFDHISYWTSILSGIPADAFLGLCALLVVCACLASVYRGSMRFFRDNPISHRYPPPLLFLLPHSYLKDAFSSGILHSKAY